MIDFHCIPSTEIFMLIFDVPQKTKTSPLINSQNSFLATIATNKMFADYKSYLRMQYEVFFFFLQPQRYLSGKNSGDFNWVDSIKL